MRRLAVPALCAGAIAAPIPVAHADSAPVMAGDAAAKLAKQHLNDVKRKQARARRRAYASVPVPPQLAAIAQCESGGDPTAVSSNGMYHGKYQFSVATWAAVGGSGLPSQAPEAEQDMRAALLYARSGPGQWPVCGQ
jgi:Transglycosylase-like domain